MESCANYLMAKDKKHDFTDEEAGGLPLFMFGESHKEFDSPGRKRMIVVADTPSYVVVYNSLAQQRISTATFHISEPYVAVFDSEGHPVTHQVNLVGLVGDWSKIMGYLGWVLGKYIWKKSAIN